MSEFPEDCFFYVVHSKNLSRQIKWGRLTPSLSENSCISSKILILFNTHFYPYIFEINFVNRYCRVLLKDLKSNKKIH